MGHIGVQGQLDYVARSCSFLFFMKKTGDVAQWQSFDLACVKPWVQFLLLKKEEKMKERRKE